MQSKPSSEPKWKLFEKLVAAVHRAEQKGADVRWNDKIAGRQFDVTLRFKAGNYLYLTVVECKDQKRKVEVGQVDAFVTKASRACANKAILVASHGFQNGCFEEAQISGIELFTLKEIDDLPPDAIELGVVSSLNMWNFIVHGEDESISLPESRGILPFLVANTILKNGSDSIALQVLLDEINPALSSEDNDEPRTQDLRFARGTVATLPDIKSGNTLERITIPVSGISFQYRTVEARRIGGIGLDPHLLKGGYQYVNSLTAQEVRYDIKDLDVGADTEILPGKFYMDAFSEFRYYCHRETGDVLTMLLIESYQHGRDIQATFDVLRENVTTYLEITDEKEIERLKAMLASLERISGTPLEER